MIPMSVDTLIRRLEPVLGAKLTPLRALALVGSETSRRNTERLLNWLAFELIGGIRPPPVSQHHGRFHLGKLLYGSQTLGALSLRQEDLFHVGVFGQTGRGKTNAVLNLLMRLKEQGIPWLVFDWKRAGYRDLVHRDVQIFTIGRDVSPFFYNPLHPPSKVEPVAWRKQFIQCLSHAYFLGHGCEVILQDVIGENTPLLTDVLRQLQSYPAKWRKLQWLQSTERAIKALCYGGIARVLNTKRGIPIETLLNQHIVLELDALTNSEAKFLVDVLMSAIYLYRKEHRHTGLRHVSVIEEAHNVLRREDAHKEAMSVMDKVFREIREYGESIVLIDQMPSTILDAALANTATQFVFSLQHGPDVRAMSGSMQLDDSSFLSQLPVGTALVKLQNRWHTPFLVRIPLISDGRQNASDTDVKDQMQGYSGHPRVIPPASLSSDVIPVLPVPDKQGINERTKQLILSVLEDATLGIAERYQRLGFHPRVGNACKRELLDRGWSRETDLSTGSGRIRMLSLTEGGRRVLMSWGYEVPGSLRHGGPEHRYWVKRAKQKLEQAGHTVHEECPIGDGHTVDLVIAGRRKRIAVEIETGKSDGFSNVQKCLKAGFTGVLTLATNRKAFRKIQTQLQGLSAGERRQVRLLCLR